MAPVLTARTRVLYWSGFVALLVVTMELVLRGLTAVSTSVEVLLVPGAGPGVPMFFEDPVLAFRPNPEFPDHDAWGFRNPEVPVRSDIIVFGDSQTYGHGVPRAAAWPLAVGRQLDAVVYNMAFNGYGPVQGLSLLDRAFELSPGLVIQAVYAGNDLFDCWDAVHVRHVSLGLEPRDEGVLRAMQEVEAEEPLRDRIDRLFDPAGASSAPSFSLRALLRTHLRLYGLLRATRRTLTHSEDRDWERLVRRAAGGQGHELAFDDGSFRTVFTPAYRLCALDLDDPRIAEGQRIALATLERLAQQVAARGARLVVVWIPTKEHVFRVPVAGQDGAASRDYTRQLEFESRLRASVLARCDEIGVDCIDVGPALEDCLAQGYQPYPISEDGHPNQVGQHAIARCVAQGLAGLLGEDEPASPGD